VRYRKLPVEIEAFPVWRICQAYRLRGDLILELPDWVIDAMGEGKMTVKVNSIVVETLEGHHETDGNDMLIRGVQGELYGCKGPIFWKTYEEVA
jgi:hypothetical protein